MYRIKSATSSKIWTPVSDFISFDNNRYAKYASYMFVRNISE